MLVEESRVPREPAAPIESRFCSSTWQPCAPSSSPGRQAPAARARREAEVGPRPVKAERLAMTEVRHGLVEWALPDFKASSTPGSAFGPTGEPPGLQSYCSLKGAYTLVEFLVLAMLAVVGLSIVAIVGFVFFLMKMVLWVVFFPLKLVLWTVFFPLKLVFKLLWLPVGLAFGTLGMGLGVIGLPLLFLVLGGVLIFGLLAVIIGLLIPAIPFVLLGLLLWSMFGRSAATA